MPAEAKRKDIDEARGTRHEAKVNTTRVTKNAKTHNGKDVNHKRLGRTKRAKS
jgi:hypothetical protein